MSGRTRMKRRLRLAVAGVSAAVSLFGQAMALKFQPDHALSGPGGIFSVAVRLENPYARAVAAYQFFLGYDADLVAVESVVWPEGAILADGQYAAGAFDGRVSRLFPEWRDGQGTDVVSVSGFRGQGEDPGRDVRGSPWCLLVHEADLVALPEHLLRCLEAGLARAPHRYAQTFTLSRLLLILMRSTDIISSS